MLGRLGFSARILLHIRPFLAPLYAWVAVAVSSHCAVVPVAVQLTLTWIGQLLIQQSMRSLRTIRTEAGEWFRADAKAEGQTVVVGGWEVINGSLAVESRWFSVVLTQDTAPWAFWKKQPFKTIAALELFASLLCVLAFKDRVPKGTPAGLVLTGITDNQGNQSVVRKCMTTRYPLCLVLMELASQLEAMEVALRLTWWRRDRNTEADNLTNSKFEEFAADRRVKINLDTIEWLVLPWLDREARTMFEELNERKLERKREGRDAKRARRPRGEKLRVSNPW